MYRLKNGKEIIITERAQPIRAHRNGCLVLTSWDRAEGVASNSTPYLYEQGWTVEEIDGGQELQRQAGAAADVEAALCEQDMTVTERLNSIEIALCELDKGGM